MNANYASMSSLPRHLGRQIARALIAYGRPLKTRVLVDWAFPNCEKHPGWHYWNVRRHNGGLGPQAGKVAHSYGPAEAR